MVAAGFALASDCAGRGAEAEFDGGGEAGLGRGISSACSRIEGRIGAGDWSSVVAVSIRCCRTTMGNSDLRFMLSSSHLKNRIELGVRWRSYRVRSRTLGSDTFRSRMGGVWSVASDA